MTTYSFVTQKAIGETGEQALDERFASDYHIRPATLTEQVQGIDRVYTNRHTGDVTRVEYKTDHKAAETGNAFIETVSVDAAGKQGWAYTSQADYIFYYVPPLGRVYVVRLAVIRRELPRWEGLYSHAQARNDGYLTHGILVPLDEFSACAEAVMKITIES
jgi:hypothetical protein